MILALSESVCRPSTGRSVLQIITFCVLTDPFKRKLDLSEENYLQKVLRHTLMLVLAITRKENSFFLVCVVNSVEILHLVRVQNLTLS